MGTLLRRIGFTYLSTLCFSASWLVLWAVTNSGLNEQPDSLWVNLSLYLGLAGSPIALVLSILGIIYDDRKSMAVIVFILSLLSTLVVFLSGG